MAVIVCRLSVQSVDRFRCCQLDDNARQAEHVREALQCGVLERQLPE
jgi:hypothetical protein